MDVRRPSNNKFCWRNIPGCDEGSTGSERRIQQEGHTEDPKNVQMQQTQTEQLLIARNVVDQVMKLFHRKRKENRESSPLQLSIYFVAFERRFSFDLTKVDKNRK